MQKRSFGSLKTLRAEIASWISRGELAAVIVHINDTYQIEEREPDVPGLARIASLIRRIRSWVSKGVGEDRTLVVHSGDFLSPSMMTTRLKFGGEQMIAVMNACGIDYATIGNHEFDVKPDQLSARLNEARFKVIVSNLAPPGQLDGIASVVLWPPANPFLAIAGFAGKQTAQKATEPGFGFTEQPLEEAVSLVMQTVKADPRIGALVALSHMDREEDKRLQEMLDTKWHKEGFAYILGGHDHHIDWHERSRRSLMLKNLSNCRTVSVILVSKQGIAAPDRSKSVARRYPSRKESIRLLTEGKEVPDNLPPFDDVVQRAIVAYRGVAPPNIRPDFREAFERCLQRAAEQEGERYVVEEGYFTGGERSLIEYGVAFSLGSFRFPKQHKSVHILKGSHLVRALPSHSGVNKVVAGWVERARAALAGGADREVIDFSSALMASGRLDATDEALRSGSTDFGNFVADAVKLATAADLALINSGAFRLDDRVGPRIMLRDLQETFLYDGPQAVIVLPMKGVEIRKFYDHARTKSGHGAFLQTSPDWSCRPDDTASVALVRHMLADGEDGYQQILAEARHCALEGLIAALDATITRRGSIIEFVEAGARQGINYNGEVRLAGDVTLDTLGTAAEVFIDAVDEFIRVCRDNRVRFPDDLSLLDSSPLSTRPKPALRDARMRLRYLVVKLALLKGMEWLREEFYDHLLDSSKQYERETDYARYLDKTMTYVDMITLFGLLRDENEPRRN